MLDLFGQPLAPVSRSRKPARAAGETIHGICGPTCFASSAPAGPLSSWENRLRARLASIGSTESPLIWQARATPAGRSISRLRPWTPRTSASDSTGSPWPTPTVADVQGGRKTRSGARSGEMLLNGLLVPWATPTLEGNYNSKGLSPTSGDGVATQMRGATALSGQTPNGSPAATARRGAPNPEFACWLMGFPDVWVSGASQAMRSFRSSRRKFSRR